MKKLICMFFMTMFMAIPGFANEFMSQTAVNIVSASSLQTAVSSSNGNQEVVEAKAPIELEKGSLGEKIVVGFIYSLLGLAAAVAIKDILK